MRSFQEFCDSLSLDQEFINDISSETTHVLHKAAGPENILMGGNFAITMKILERYHEWLHSDSENA